MTNREALAIIIESLKTIPTELKEKLINGIPGMDDETVASLGYELGMVKGSSIETSRKIFNAIRDLKNDDFLKRANKPD